MSEQPKHPLTVLIETKKHAIGEALQNSPVNLDEFLVGLKSAVAKDHESGQGMLIDCVAKNPNSVLQRLIEAAQLGLSPAPVHQHFHLIPRKLQGGGLTCTSVIGFRGFCDLARRSGEVEAIGAELVFKGEEFAIHPVDGSITHDRDPFADHEPQDLVGAYAWCKLKGSGSTLSRVMSKKDLDARRSQSKTDKIWKPWWKEMYRKTVLRALLNSGMVPLGEQSAQIRGAIEREAQQEEEIVDADVTVVDADVSEPEPEPSTEQG